MRLMGWMGIVTGCSRMANRRRKDGDSGSWANFADGFGFWVCHMVLRVLSVEVLKKMVTVGYRELP
jgi:hypothetical protein